MTRHQSLFTMGIAGCLLACGIHQAEAQAITIPFNDYAGLYGGSPLVHTWGPFTAENRPAGADFFWANASQWREGIAASTGAIFAPSSNFAPGSSTTLAITHFSEAAVDGGIYAFEGASYSATNNNPIADLNTLFIEIGTSRNSLTILGLTLRFDHADGTGEIELPTYTLNYDLNIPSGNPDAPVAATSAVFGYQFDLSGYVGITNYSIFWDSSSHTNLYGLQVTESTQTFSGTALIPEPSTYALIGLGLAGATLLRRRKLQSRHVTNNH